MPEEQLKNKLKDLKKKLKELDARIATTKLKLQRAQQRGGQKRELEGELKKGLDGLCRQWGEIQKEISYLEKFVNLQEETETKEKKVQELENQIKDLEKRNEKIKECDKEIKELQEKKKHLEKTIIQLKYEIQDLNKKIEERDKNVLLLEKKMKENDLNHQNRIQNLTAKHDSEIKDLRVETSAMIKKQEDSPSKKMEELEKEVQGLQTENSKIKNDLKMLGKNVNCADENQPILYIGQVCSDLETNWYRHVMPEHCINWDRSYKVKNIMEDIDDEEMLSKEEQIEAKWRWEELQSKSNWKRNKRLFQAIKRLQYQRNQAAHPQGLNEEGARKAAEELLHQGKLNSKPSFEDVRKLIELWVTSKSL